MTYHTCGNTGRFYNPDLPGYQNCPDCNPFYAEQTAAPAQPKMMVLHCHSVQMQPSDEYAQVILNGVEYDEALRQVPIAEIIRYYGANLLDHISPDEIRAYLNGAPEKNEP